MQRDHLLTHPSARSRADHFEATWAASLAEALHVDGHYHVALPIWQQVAASRQDPDLCLKLAISWSTLERGDEAEKILGALARLPAYQNEVQVVRAQIAWREGRLADADRLFGEVLSKVPNNLLALNARAVMNASMGAKGRAHRLMTAAAEQGDPLAIFNMALTKTSANPSLEQFDSALVAAAHRFEGHVAWAKYCAKNGDKRASAAALRRAQIRRDAQPCLFVTQPLSVKIAVQGDVEASGIDLIAVVTCDVPHALTFQINPALDCTASVDIARKGGRRLDQVTTKPSNRVELRLSGSPKGRAVAITNDRIELAGASGWLPVFDSHISAEYDLDLSVPPGWGAASMGDPDEPNAPLLIALPKVSERGAMTFLSQTDPVPIRIELARAQVLFERVLSLWTEVTEMPSPELLPTLACIDGTKGQFCYAGNDVIRAPVAVVQNPSGVNLMCHEVSHVFWNRKTTFEDCADWWREGLAEYGLHLAEDAGLITGYRRSIHAKTQDRPELAMTSVQALRQMQDHAAQDMYRAKSGYVIHMLRTLLGTTAFGTFLRLLAQRTGRMTGYEVEALASWIAPHSLRWFFNQWVRDDASLVSDVAWQRDTSGNGTAIIELKGWATPGSPVCVETHGATGTVTRHQIVLERGRQQLPDQPQSVIVDPERDWFGLFTEAT